MKVQVPVPYLNKSAPGDPNLVQPGIPGHHITVPMAGGALPFCECGVVGGTGSGEGPHGGPLLADHIKELLAKGATS